MQADDLRGRAPMITVEQARRFFPQNKCPSDKDIERMLATAYAIAEREWTEMTEEKTNVNAFYEQEPKKQ